MGNYLGDLLEDVALLLVRAARDRHADWWLVGEIKEGEEEERLMVFVVE